MMKTALKKSIVLHLVIVILCMVDLPIFWRQHRDASQVPILVDLKDVKISEMTNLPAKAKFGKENKEASKIKRKIEKKYTKEAPKPKAKPKQKPKAEPKKNEPKKEKTPEVKKVVEPKKAHLEAELEKKVIKPVEKTEKKKEPEKTAQKKVKEPKKNEAKPKKGPQKTPELANPLKSLLASVDALEKAEGEKSQTATIKEETIVNNMGVEGGIGGSYFSELSISEMDAIAGCLRSNWNLDPGAMGIEDMIVEIEASLNQDGSVRKVEVTDVSRYNSDSHFRSVAESAQRSVYSCQPYSILSEKYADKYNKWKVLQLHFNPLDNSVK